MKPVRVLVIDDSKLMRMLLKKVLNADPGIEVVGDAEDAFQARTLIKSLDPDVLTLDLSMPRMNGLQFLENLMRLHPMRVVIVSSLTEQHGDMALQALEFGAVDLVNKPASAASPDRATFPKELVQKVRSAATARVKKLTNGVRSAADGQSTVMHSDPTAIQKEGRPPNEGRPADRVVAIGASTGGTEAIKDVLSAMNSTRAAVVITQHIPPEFTGPFTKRLDHESSMTVTEACDGESILAGHAYVAPGNRHLEIVREGVHYRCRLNDAPPIGHHKPAVDIMFRTVAEAVGVNATGVLLTGMGRDGAAGLKAMRDAGARTMAQDEETSVVWGMPGAAVKLDAVDQVLPLQAIAGELNKLISNDIRSRRRAPMSADDRIRSLEREILALRKEQASSSDQATEVGRRDGAGSE